MITHQAVGAEAPALLGDLATGQIEKRGAVPIFAKVVLARGDVIQRACEFHTQRTGHAGMLIRLPYKVKR